MSAVCFLIAESGLAWGEAGHYIVAEAATSGVPAEMPRFFHEAYSELVWLAYDPDRWKRTGGESIDSANDPDHFLDYEYVARLELPRRRYDYVDLLHRSGELRRQGLDGSDPGFLPWRIAELSELLVTQWRLWRAAVPGSPEQKIIERDIIHHAGILGHYAGDAANPHHATANYNGWVLGPNPEGFASDCEVHARFESVYVAHAVEASQVVPKVGAPSRYDDYFAAALAFIRHSNALVPQLYRIDRDGGFDIFRPVRPDAHAFATDRLAAGASFLRDLWWSTWRNAAEPPRRRR
ncbi:MAG TPA: hypothetical protein VNL91_09980 [Thermoanaerobaculia bacterium]|nr:hypothetical protein [Thermoanaerobaculia bacterium]